MLGYVDEDEIRSLPSLFESIWREDDRDAIAQVMRAVDSGSLPQIIHCVGQKKSGEVINLQVFWQNIDWHGEPAQQLLLLESLDSAAVAEALRESEARLRLVFNQQFQFMAILSPEGRVIEINDLPLLLLGVDRESYQGQLFWQTPAWSSLPEWQDIIRGRVLEACKSDSPVLSEELFQANGEMRYANASYSGIRDGSGNLKYILVQSTDITDKKLAEIMLSDNLQRLDLALSAASMGTWEWSIISGVLWWSDETCKIFGIESHEFGNDFESYLSFAPVESRKKLDQRCKQIVKNAGKVDVFQIEHEIVRHDGSRGFIEIRGKIFLDDKGEAQRITGICMDVTETKRVSDELKILHRAMESSSSSVVITNTERVIKYVNQKFTYISGYDKSEILGKPFDFLKSGETSDAIYIDMWDRVSDGHEWRGEIKNKRKSGESYWERLAISSVKNTENKITHYIAIQEDITHEYELSEKLSYQASHDALTGLINRYEFERHVESVPSVFGGKNVIHALCFLDLDQFKLVNDTCGHLAGDNLLRQLSVILQEVVGDQGILARLGGDEFAVFIENSSLEQARSIADAMLEAVKDFQFAWEEHVFRLGVSIGLVPVTSEIPKFSELLQQADAACYMAKDLGRNRIHIYLSDDKELNLRHGEMQWATRIYRALNENLFCLYAQVIGALDSQRPPMYELLVRMRGDNEELIPPGAFIPAAERFNLIHKIDCWVVENALITVAKHPEFLQHVEYISINLSGHSIADEATRDFVITQISKHRIDASKLCFEVTETAAVLNLSVAEDFITALKFMGCRFALDDFGSGVSSFGYLKKLPVDYLKIDGMFVRDIAEDPIDHAMVKSINEIGHVMGMMTIAEFVENDSVQGKLTDLGVDYAQGFGVGQPQPFRDVIQHVLQTL